MFYILVCLLLTYFRAVCDARLDFTVVKSIVITLAFAVEEELNEWAKMRLSNLLNLRKKVAAMTSATIRMNFDFQKWQIEYKVDEKKKIKFESCEVASRKWTYFQ